MKIKERRLKEGLSIKNFTSRSFSFWFILTIFEKFSIFRENISRRGERRVFTQILYPNLSRYHVTICEQKEEIRIIGTIDEWIIELGNTSYILLSISAEISNRWIFSWSTLRGGKKKKKKKKEEEEEGKSDSFRPFLAFYIYKAHRILLTRLSLSALTNCLSASTLLLPLRLYILSYFIRSHSYLELF